MKKIALVLFILAASTIYLHAQQVWSSSGGTLVFTKAGFADWTQPANQDRISDSVWITRASTQGMFNIKKETAYQTGSPAGTEWALGTTVNYSTLAYKSYIALSNSNPSSLIGKDLVLHLIEENIYIDIKFSAYSSGATGAELSYTRATTVLDVSSTTSEFIQDFALMQNYPNPFNPVTMINYQLPMNSSVSLKVYDALGKEVATLVNEMKEAGTYSAPFDGSKLSSGIYFYMLKAGNYSATKKLSLIK